MAATTLTDSWRTASSRTAARGDCASTGHVCDGHGGEMCPSGIGGGSWYRFEGVGGDALPLTHPGPQHCGTNYPGWLSGCQQPPANCGASCSVPAASCNTPWQYLTASEGVVEMTTCFDYGNSPCLYPQTVGVVRCSGFLLWRLPYAPTCDSAYCTAPSGL